MRLGEVDLNSNQEKIEDVCIEEIIVHQNYTPPAYYYDIAVIKLERKVKFTSFILPACLQRSEVYPEMLQTAGWGRTSFSEYFVVIL